MKTLMRSRSGHNLRPAKGSRDLNRATLHFCHIGLLTLAMKTTVKIDAVRTLVLKLLASGTTAGQLEASRCTSTRRMNHALFSKV